MKQLEHPSYLGGTSYGDWWWCACNDCDGTYADDGQLAHLVTLKTQKRDLNKTLCELQCIYEAYVSHRTWIETGSGDLSTDVEHNCEGSSNCAVESVPAYDAWDTECMDVDDYYAKKEELAGDIDNLQHEVSIVLEAVEYEMDQRATLLDFREDAGITDFDLSVIYAAREQIVLDFAPESTLAADIADETPWNWIISAAMVVGGGAALVYLYRRYGSDYEYVYEEVEYE